MAKLGYSNFYRDGEWHFVTTEVPPVPANDANSCEAEENGDSSNLEQALEHGPNGEQPAEAKRQDKDPKEEAEDLPLVWAGQLLKTKAPARKWLVDGWMPERQVHLLAGDGGNGKSLFALQLAASVATGKSWVGLSVQKGRVHISDTCITYFYSR